MILTDYYRFEKIATKAKMRLDCTASTESYPIFEEKRKNTGRHPTIKRDGYNEGDLIIYYGNVSKHFGGDVHRKADKSLTIGSNNLSSIFIPDPTASVAYGDVKGTSDAMLMVLENFYEVNGEPQQGAKIEIYIARGRSKDRIALYNLMKDGEFEDEMNLLQERANTTSTHPATCKRVQRFEKQNRSKTEAKQKQNRSKAEARLNV